MAPTHLSAMNASDSAPPPQSCDCHAHIMFGPDKYPYIADKVYAIDEALPEDYWAMARDIGISRAVITAPSAYGTNNAALLDTIAMDPKNTRGVASVAYDVSTAELESLHKQGIRGVRCNLVDKKHGKGTLDLDLIRGLARRLKPLGWHIEFLMHVDAHPDLDMQLKDFPVPVSFGHFGYVVPTTKGTGSAGFQALLRLVRDEVAYVKLTAPYRLTPSHPPHPEVKEFGIALVEANSRQMLWGSDWPFVVPLPGGPTGPYKDTGLDRPKPIARSMYEVFRSWVDAETAHRILVENPNRLYQFE